MKQTKVTIRRGECYGAGYVYNVYGQDGIDNGELVAIYTSSPNGFKLHGSGGVRGWYKCHRLFKSFEELVKARGWIVLENGSVDI